MSERTTSAGNQKLILSMIGEMKDDMKIVKESIANTNRSIAQIETELKSIPKIDDEKHALVNHRLDSHDEEIKGLKSAAWAIVSALLLMFLASLWQLLVK